MYLSIAVEANVRTMMQTGEKKEEKEIPRALTFVERLRLHSSLPG